jgi:hypothetical protein
MSHRFFKTSVVVTVSLVLLYYSVAWVVLGCSHDEDRSNEQAVLQNKDVASNAFQYQSANPDPLILECVCPNYHTELMAGSSSPSQLQRVISDPTAHASSVSGLQTMSVNGTMDIWRRVVFGGIPSSGFPIGLPSYRSLSILRI